MLSPFWATNIENILMAGYQEAAEFGLGAMDALHIAAAVATEADEFITSEKTQQVDLSYAEYRGHFNR